MKCYKVLINNVVWSQEDPNWIGRLALPTAGFYIFVEAFHIGETAVKEALSKHYRYKVDSVDYIVTRIYHS